MALTLRELLELQRRQREEKAIVPPTATPSLASTGTSMPLQPSPPQAPPEAAAKVPPVVEKSKGLLSRLQVSAPKPDQVEYLEKVKVASVPDMTTTIGGPPKGNGSAAPSPIFTPDETETLKKNLAFLAANMDEKDIIGQILRTTVRQLQEHPELSSVMIDTDYDLIVSAARRSVKFVQRKKEERVDKVGKKQAEKDELANWLKDQGIDL